MGVLVVLCFLSVLLLSSQSRASYPTYALALLVIATFSQWRDAFAVSIFPWIGALLLWLGLSTLWSEPFVARDAASVVIRMLLVFSFVIAVAECQLRGQLQKWMDIALSVCGVVVVLVAIANFYLTDPEDGRLNGLGQLDTHVIAALVYGTVGIFVIRMFYRSDRKAVRTVAVIGLCAILFAIYLSDSRNAWVSVPVGLIVFLLANLVKDARQFAVATVSVGSLALIAFVVLLFNDEVRALLLPRGTSFRLEIWTAVLNRVGEASWLFGRGILSPTELVSGEIVFYHAHNMYLAVLEQGGLVALFFYLVVIGKAIKVLWHNFEHEDAKLALAILALGLSAHLLDGHELIDKVGASWFLIWLPVAIAAGLGWQQSQRPNF